MIELGNPVPGYYPTNAGGVFGAARTGPPPHDHAGWDHTAPKGVPVRLTAAGRITFAGMSTGLGGLTVKASHAAAWSSGYYHLSRIDVRLGDRLPAGAIVGLVGDTGNAAGSPHLHAEWRHHGKAIDPALILAPDFGPNVKAAQSRLLALGITLTVDGLFGPRTAAAVATYQERAGLDTTGRLDAATIAHLLPAPR